MRHHLWTEACLDDLLSAGVRFGKAASLYDKTVLGVALLIVTEPSGLGWVVRQEEHDQSDRSDGDGAFDNGEPPKSFDTGVLVEMADSICNTATKGSSSRGRSQNKGDSDRTLLYTVPERDIIHNSCGKRISMQKKLQSRPTETCSGIPGKKPASKAPIKNLRAATLA